MAYDGKARALLNRIIEGQSVHPPEFYKALVLRFMIKTSVVAFGLCIFLIISLPIFRYLYKNGLKWINIWLVICSVIVTLVPIELLLRHRHAIFKRELILKNENDSLEYISLCPDKKLVYRGIPNKCGNNSHGYRDYGYSYTKAPGTYRILVIGDSIAFGEHINFELTFSKVLEKKLNTSVESKNFEVILLAQTGYSTSQELWIMRNEAFLYHPDAILWSYCLNDPADPIFHNANGELGKYFYNPTSYAFDFIRKRIFLLLEKKKARKCQAQSFDSLMHCVYWDQVEKNIKEIGKISQQNKIPVFFLIHPDFVEGEKFSEYSLSNLHKRLFTLASSSDLIPIDLLDCYKKYKYEEIRFQDPSSPWFDCWHLNAQGHLAVANYLYELLQKYWREND